MLHYLQPLFRNSGFFSGCIVNGPFSNAYEFHIPLEGDRLSMAMITVVAKIRAKEESLEIVKNELLKLVGPTRKEAGCIDYQLYQDNQEPSVFVFYENWASAIDLEKHKDTDHYKRYAATVFGLIEERVVHKLAKIG